MIKEEIVTDNYFILQKIKKMTQQKGIQAMMPFEIIIR